MQIVLHQTQHQIGDFKQIFQDLKLVISNPVGAPQVSLFPELYLLGYPLQDLVLQKDFIERYLENLNSFEEWLKSQKENSKHTVLVGGLHYQFDEDELPLTIENVIYECVPGQGLRKLYTKCLLPNYDIFDEEKYFTPGSRAAVIERHGQRIGLLICEDMWFSSTHDIDPIKLLDQLCGETGALDLIINLSASPYFLGKDEKREQRAKALAQHFGAPFAYVNRVGGEDEILFDGQSFVTNGEKIWSAKKFEEDILTLEKPDFEGERKELNPNERIENSWESLFKAELHFQKKSLPILTPWGEEQCEEVIEALCFGLQEYAEKCGFKKFLVALSGGIDSGLVLYLAKLALKPGQELEAIYMPSQYSSSLSTQLAQELCDNLGIPLRHFPIKFLHSTIGQEFSRQINSPLTGLADENIQSRLRGAILYGRSNQTGAMVINTSNKSELAVGYSTLYGDSVGAVSLLGDLYKSQVYDLARHLVKTRGGLPMAYIERPPSAELRENQQDSQSLPPYEKLDAILEGLLSYRLSQKKLQGIGFNGDEVAKVYGLYTKSEYKRNQFCPIIKVKAKSFGFGYRMPITKKS